mmetsp:Transcript_25630/g.44706  ORF Transcript_25630/g.44706 Transcript_25630/m.44706 type:complete len:187 (-) Transcript_25630:74-634(-)
MTITRVRSSPGLVSLRCPFQKPKINPGSVLVGLWNTAKSIVEEIANHPQTHRFFRGVGKALDYKDQETRSLQAKFIATVCITLKLCILVFRENSSLAGKFCAVTASFAFIAFLWSKPSSSRIKSVMHSDRTITQRPQHLQLEEVSVVQFPDEVIELPTGVALHMGAEEHQLGKNFRHRRPPAMSFE